MFGSIAKSLFGNANDRVIKAMKPLVQAINDREGDFADLDQAAVRAKINEIRDAIIGGASKDEYLVDVFALVREAAKRTLGQRHFDVQLMGGIALDRGDIAEMKTGEGKTLVATLAVALNALDGRGVHVVT
ncbi:MAG: preprotein translocase subunit SecA, partial [Candidatus Puniceispirillum sp.]